MKIFFVTTFVLLTSTCWADSETFDGQCTKKLRADFDSCTEVYSTCKGKAKNCVKETFCICKNKNQSDQDGAYGYWDEPIRPIYRENDKSSGGATGSW